MVHSSPRGRLDTSLMALLDAEYMKNLTDYSCLKLRWNQSAKCFHGQLIYSKNYKLYKASIHFGAP